jgi:predicted nucleic acid-binding protein
LLDTSGLLAALVATQHLHEQAAAALAAAERPLVLSPFVLAEVDYFVASWGGVAAEAALLDEVAKGVYSLAAFEADDVGEAAAVIDAYSRLKIGLADASIVVLAGRHGTSRVLTLDERHFRALRTPTGKKFTVLPADA